MDYFVQSPFFDRTSNNATLRMQMMFSRGGMEGVDEQAELAKFIGTEYIVAHAHPPGLFVIHKRERSSPQEAVTTGLYYVLNDNIYQSPSLYTVVNERILTSLHALSSSLSLIKSRKPHWTPENLYRWEVKPPVPSSSSFATRATQVDAQARPSDDQEARVDLKRRADLVEESDALGTVGPASAATNCDDEDAPRSASAFNPLLFRALQTVGSALLEPPPPPVEPARPTAVRFGVSTQRESDDKQSGAIGVKSEDRTTRDSTPGNDLVSDSRRIRTGPTGKRIPKAALG